MYGVICVLITSKLLFICKCYVYIGCYREEIHPRIGTTVVSKVWLKKVSHWFV